MKILLTIVFLSLFIATSASASTYTDINSGTTYYDHGYNISGSDGSFYTRDHAGNIYGSDVTYTKVGDNYYGSDGQNYTKIGKDYFDNNGSRIMKILD